MLSESKLAIICKRNGVKYESRVMDNVQFIGGRVKDPWNHFFVLCILSQKVLKKILTAEIRDFYEGKGASWRRGQTTGTIEV
jgi:hypothetical protein